ncbi:TonB-linked outer membrane protein, SusC/RagA family [bacterium A37T11]|nr:TonB-linked outer membrane protein, SusC/RagA family [bacterium A37T11]
MYKKFTYGCAVPIGLQQYIYRVMKLTTFLIVITFIQVSAAGFAQQVSFRKRQASLPEIFAEINKQTGYNVFWSPKLVTRANLVDADFVNAAIPDVLDQVLKNQQLAYEILGKSIVIKVRADLPVDKELILAYPEVRGRVVDSLGKPLQGASIRVLNAEGKRTTLQTSTDKQGEFLLQNVPQDAMLEISFVGYVTQKMIANANMGSIVLRELSSELEEASVIVNTGYQNIPKERATGSFVFIDSALFNKRVGADVISRLEGNVSGLLFNRNVSSTLTNTGGYNLSIRGRSTLFANDQPLVVVDGFPYDGDISNINPNDFASVSVLKDAAASSIWGVKSGNGVIVLTTKRGGQNQMLSIDVNANTTIGDKPNLSYSPNWIKSTDFIDIEKTLFEQGYYDSDLNSSYYPVISPVVSLLDRAKRGLITDVDASSQIDALRDKDFRKDVKKYLYRQSINQQYNTSFRGGGAHNDYFISMGFDNSLSNQIGDRNYRITLNANNNLYLFKGLTLSLGYNYIQAKATNNSPLGSLYPEVSKPNYYPYAQLVDMYGKSLNLPKNYADSYIDTVGNGQFQNWKYNPMDELKYADNTSNSMDNRFNLGLKYSFLNGFGAEIKYQYERLNSTGNNYYSESTYYTRNLINQFTDLTASNALGLVNPVPVGGIADINNSILNAHHMRAQVSYSHLWKEKHNLTAIAGAEVNQNITESNSSRVYGYDKSTGINTAVDLIGNYLMMPSGTTSTIPHDGVGFGKITNRYVSYYSNAAYTYDGRYVLSASGRIDKSNLFGVKTNQKSVPLYSVGAAWLLSNEPFFNSDLLPYAKVRFTYGYNANVNTNLTAFTVTSYAGNSSFYSSLPYSIIANPGNPQLKWEKIRMTDFGVDFSLKKEILAGSIDFYIKNGINLIGQAPMAPSTGVNTLYGNFSDTKGHGLDLVLNSINLQSNVFAWRSSFMLSYATDKVTKYDISTSAPDYIMYGDGAGGSLYPLVGRPLFSVYSYNWEGLNTSGDPQGIIDGKTSTNYSNILSNTSVDSIIYNGPARPTTFGSFRNTLSYGPISLSLNIIYKMNYYFRRSSISYVSLYQNWTGHKDYYKRWMNPGDEKFTNVPSLQYPPVDGSREKFYSYSEALVDKGDHIKLQDISINYEFLKNKLKKFYIQSLNVYFYANNIGILWRSNKDHLDPDLYGSNSFPLPRTYSFGLKANF